MTNFEKIRDMRLDEMATVLIQIAELPDCVAPESQDCEKCAIYEICLASNDAPPSGEAIREWLESEVKDDA